MKKRFKIPSILLNVLFVVSVVVVAYLVYNDISQRTSADNKEAVNNEKGEIRLKEKIYNMALVKRAPVFPGCEDFENQFYIRKCLSDNIEAHFVSNFKESLLKTISPDTERKIIAVFFHINSRGHINNVRSFAPNTKLEEEMLRVTKLLPRMIPGTVKGKNVDVSYSVMITENDGKMVVTADS